MSLEAVIFVVVCVVTVMTSFIIARMTRDITFFAVGTDNEKLLCAAARVEEWRWISDMHKYGSGKARMKDTFVLALVGAQRILGDRTSDYPLVVLCVLSNSISAILLFLLAKMYWGANIGLPLFALFVTSFWPYLTALFGAPICMAQMLFLASVYLMQGASSVSALSGLTLYFASGVTVGLMLFASASARKYLPLVIGAFFYSQRNSLSMTVAGMSVQSTLFLRAALPSIMAFVLFLILAIALLSYKHIIAVLYIKHPSWLRETIGLEKELDLQHYLVRAGKLMRLVLRGFPFVILYGYVCLLFFRSAMFYFAQLSFLLGAGCVALWFIFPHVLTNIEGYFAYWNAPKFSGHFRLYFDYFKRIGKPISENMRGAGFRWVIRFFWHIAPFHSAFWVLSLGLLGYALFPNGLDRREMWAAIGIFLLSVSPVLVGEITRGPQEGRTYYPAFVGMLLLVGYGTFKLEQLLSLPAQIVFWSLYLCGLLFGTVWNVWVFLNDVWPARMAPAWLARTLKKLGIKRFYTYDTPYNDAFVNVMPKNTLKGCDIRFINTLAEVKEGYVVIPGTSAKALHMESHRCAIEHGDFDSDPVLNQLIESREISRYAVATFKTFGTSRMWVHEGDVPSYRDFIIGEIREYDRWRGWAWILDAKKIYDDGWHNCVAKKQDARKGSMPGLTTGWDSLSTGAEEPRRS